VRLPLASCVAALAVALAPAARAQVGDAAARIGDETLPLSRVDAASGGKTQQILRRLHQVASRALDALIDARLLADAGPASEAPPAIPEEEIDAFRAERAEDFEGPFAPGGAARDPAVQRAAIRHYLESQALERARAARLASLRARHRIEPLLPDASELASPLAPDRPVARIDGQPLRAGALETRAALRLYRLRGELARERLRQAEALIEERLLEREAARRGTDVASLLAAETRAPDDADIRAFQERERAAGRPVPVAERARPYLAFRARHAARERLLEAARSRDAVTLYHSEPAPPRLPVETAGAPSLGPADGARLVVYGNYGCEVCRAVQPEIDRLLATSGEVRVVFRDWIPQYDPAAREAAALARCADRQGGFAAMRDALLAAPPPGFGGGFDLPALAARAGLDEQALRACIGGDVQRAIDADTRRARALGFESAPAFVAEGIPLSGAQSAAGLARALREGLTPDSSRGGASGGS
jgi:hypothetical protein